MVVQTGSDHPSPPLPLPSPSLPTSLPTSLPPSIPPSILPSPTKLRRNPVQNWHLMLVCPLGRGSGVIIYNGTFLDNFAFSSKCCWPPGCFADWIFFNAWRIDAAPPGHNGDVAQWGWSRRFSPLQAFKGSIRLCIQRGQQRELQIIQFRLSVNLIRNMAVQLAWGVGGFPGCNWLIGFAKYSCVGLV